MKKLNMTRWLWLSLVVGILTAAPAHAFYNPTKGTWLNRDSMEESGGRNLYGFAANDGVNSVDRNGLDFGTWIGHPGYNFNPPSQPTPQDGLHDEAWRMFIFLFAGDLGENYELSDSAIEAAKRRCNKDLIVSNLRKAVGCNQSGTTVIKQRDDGFTIEKNPGIVNMGNWQLRLRSTANWKCGDPVVEGGKCCCTCSADIHVKALMSKTYTFQANGYNQYNSSWGIRVLNGLAKDEQYYMRWYHDSDGPAFFISAEFDFSFSQSFKRCGKEQQP